MKNVYKLPERDVITKGTGNTLLTNGFGSYYSIHPNFSYQGWYQLNAKSWRMQKIIESITPLDEGSQTTLYQHFYGLRRLFSSGAQDTIIPYQKVLLYNTHELDGRVMLTLDHRETYEQSRLGRVYDIKIDQDFVLIHFKQEKENGELEYEHFLGIKGVRNVNIFNNWKEKHYEVDKKRNAHSNYWVYEALTFIPHHHAVFSSAETAAEARTLADIAYFHFDDIFANLHDQSLQKIPDFKELPDIHLIAAAQASSWSLLSLLQNFSFDHNLMPGIYAGLPWFFQIWSRDELISLGGLLTLAKKNPEHLQTIKKILSRHVKGILSNGTLSNRFPHSMLGSIDSLGWLAKRIVGFIKQARKQKQLYTLFVLEELIEWYEELKKALYNAKNNYGKKINGAILFTNKEKETWMDTSYEDDGRAGVRIEIQALFYSLYEAINVLGKLTDSKDVFEYHKEQSQFKQAIRKTFMHDEYKRLLIDGVNGDYVDKTYRPNVFMAAYVAKNLLSNKEWKRVFDEHLKQLYLPWGGIASIGRDDSRFQSHYTGQNNKSYHRGDSWYFINHMAAKVMFEIDDEHYKKEINEILHASTRDILEEGFSGHASEISSASVQEAHASLAQAWSSATFVELVDSLYPSDD